ncbi:MAG: 2,3-bisphosphoglycerate-independent phosphoglycerate mutase [bacterium]|nr:2,3-bisphosphoglycerate-independent phosphoglycerate mutase [bacterium]
MYKPLVLVIMDGVGLTEQKSGNALASAKLSNLRHISRSYPGTALQAAGLTVGIPWGEVGNSEVGHIAIGAGLIMYQHLARINQSISSEEFFKFPIWDKAIEHAKKNKSAIHLAGLLSDGGVHSHQDHLFTILQLLSDKKFSGPVFIHIFTDGRDAPTQSAPGFIRSLERKTEELGLGKIATVIGRYYAMDRDRRVERIQVAYDLMVSGRGQQFVSPIEAVETSYNEKVTDEFIKASVMIVDGEAVGSVKDGDAVIFFNFRSDRMRQLAGSFIKSSLKDLFILSMTQYDQNFEIPTVFSPESVPHPLAEVISSAGKKQLHIAETEKYAHVTYFFNGGQEKPFVGEDRILVQSPKVASYDKKPEMSARELTKRLVEGIEQQKYDFIVANFANGDMVGHTGDLKATTKAMDVVDECVGVVMKATLAAGGALLITADHGNCEEMVDLETGKMDTEHEVNPVPFWLVADDKKGEAVIDTKINIGGILPDVAPTILELLDLPVPPEMIGTSLLKVIFRQPI